MQGQMEFSLDYPYSGGVLEECLSCPMRGTELGYVSRAHAVPLHTVLTSTSATVASCDH